ncbi:MAG TPA: tRNA pseudouridine(54/55) synthase Pus10, partial [Candidatus Lokiarchaeia archaeon]
KIQSEKVKINDLRYSNKDEVIQIKMNAENTRKSYKVLVQADKDLDLTEFNNKVIVLKNRLENQKIFQRTPNRVSHRRADLIREKYVFNIKEKYIEPKLFEFVIETQGGTYIKELISGDNGRTTPSFSEIFGLPLICKELDVINIEK